MNIPGIVNLTSKTIYGFTARKSPIYQFQPFDESIAPFLVGCSYEDRSHNIIALAKITTQPFEKVRRGFIERIIGRCGDIEPEREALLWRYAPYRWTSSNTPKQIKTPSFEKHTLLDVPTINIDPPGCRDIDDCVSIWKEGDRTMVAITIADVYEWIESNPSLIPVASSIGQTFYSNGQAILPMLPRDMSENLCSLIPGVPRLGLAIQFEWMGDMIKDMFLRQVVIVNKKSYTYETVKHAKDFPVETLKELASWLGGHDIDDPHEWVEQLMLFYNREAAMLLKTYEHGVWRGHTEPDYHKLTKFRSFGVGIEFLAQKSAIYTDYASKHWGLGDVPYCHASSPIRRWADVVNQSVLKKKTMIPADIDHMNKVCQHAKRYDRDMFFLDAIVVSKSNELIGCVSIDTDEVRSRFWVPEWKKIITVKNAKIPEGNVVTIKFFLDFNNLTWKKRMVFRVEGIDCPELLIPEQYAAEYLEEILGVQHRS